MGDGPVSLSSKQPVLSAWIHIHLLMLIEQRQLLQVIVNRRCSSSSLCNDDVHTSAYAHRRAPLPPACRCHRHPAPACDPTPLPPPAGRWLLSTEASSRYCCPDLPVVGTLPQPTDTTYQRPIVLPIPQPAPAHPDHHPALTPKRPPLLSCPPLLMGATYLPTYCLLSEWWRTTHGRATTCSYRTGGPTRRFECCSWERATKVRTAVGGRGLARLPLRPRGEGLRGNERV